MLVSVFNIPLENRELNERAYQEELVETKDVIEAQLMEALLAGKGAPGGSSLRAKPGKTRQPVYGLSLEPITQSDDDRLDLYPPVGGGRR